MQDASVHQYKTRPSIQTYVSWMAVGCLIPCLIGTSLLVLEQYKGGREQLRSSTIATARAVLQAVDGRLLKARDSAATLAMSPMLQRRELAGFHAFVRKASPIGNMGSIVAVSDSTGQLLLVTTLDFGAPLPIHGSPDTVRRVFETRAPVISDVFEASVLGKPIMYVDTPVMADGEVIYDLSIGLLPEIFNQILRDQRLPAEWVAVVFDSSGTIAGRTHLAEKFVGQKGSAGFIAAIANAPEGAIDTVTREGIPTLSAWSRSATTGWSVGIGIPKAQLEEEFFETLNYLAVFLAVMVVLAFGLAIVVGRKITGSLSALADAAARIGNGSGSAIDYDSLHVRETASIAGVIERTSEQLRNHSVELETSADALKNTVAVLESRSVTLQRFIYVLSHDMREPLNSIINFSGVLVSKSSSLGEDARRKYLDRVRGGAVRMKSLLDDLQSYVRLDNPRFDFAEHDFDAIARDVIEDLNAQILDSGATIECGPLPVIRCDRSLIRLLVQNLVSNAIKFVAPGVSPRVTIGEIAGPAGEWRFAVTDNGIGIAPEHLEGLFTPFHRLNLKSTYAGTGLGLSICRKIMELHGGTIFAESVVGGGTRFVFTLPRVAVRDTKHEDS